MTARQNVLFIITDQFRADCLHGALADHVALPHIRAFANDSVTFRNHYSVANPCGPSRVSILTGQYAMNHRAVRNGTPLPADKPNLATELRKSGYRPLLFGYTDTTRDPRGSHPNDPALHTYEEVMPGFEQTLEMRLEESWPWRAHLLAKGYSVPPYPDIFRPTGDRPDDPAFYRAEDSDTAFLTDQVIKDLAARPPGWMAHVTYIRPHPPLVAPEPYNRQHDPDTLPKPVGLEPGKKPLHLFFAAARRQTNLAKQVVGIPKLDATDENIAVLRSIYLGLAAEVDHHVGRLLSFLKDSGQYDDTLIILTSDHGEMLGDHHSWGKMTAYDAAFHTPLIIRDPRNPDQHGNSVSEPTESIDLTPTILDLTGTRVPDTMDGKSLKPFLYGQTPDDWRSFTFSELDFGDPLTPTFIQENLDITLDAANLAILRDGKHTLIHFAGDLPQILFDHSGAGEAENVAGEAEKSVILAELTRKMLNHRMQNAEGLFSRVLVTTDGVQRAET